jgi:cell division ATPase FtsA
MGIFSKIEKREEMVVVFDVGSFSVGAAVFYIRKNGSPEIIYSIREPVVFENEINFDKFLSSTIKSLEVVVNKICMMHFGSPDKIFCVLSSPWYASQTRVVNLEKNTPFVFNSKLADSLIEKEVILFKEEHSIKDTESHIVPIELKNMKIMLNGYDAPKPLGQKAKELEMTLFISMSQRQILDNITDAINKHFNNRVIKFSSFVMASFSVARDMFVNQENFLLVDIGGEITDISMVKKDVLCESISFPMGRNHMVRGISKALGCTLDEAKSYISLYKDNHMEDSAAKKFKPFMDQFKIDWLKDFQEALANLSNDISIPSTIFLTVEKDLADFFSEIIKNEQFNQYTLTESKFRIIVLGTEALHGIAVFKENIIRDPFLIIESIYINRFIR